MDFPQLTAVSLVGASATDGLLSSVRRLQGTAAGVDHGNDTAVVLLTELFALVRVKHGRVHGDVARVEVGVG